MARPVIGISAAVGSGGGEGPRASVPYAYIEGIEGAGGRALLIPPDARDADVVEVLDALLLTGGGDIVAARYGAERHPLSNEEPLRDASEFLLLSAALARRLPVLGVCRGMQVIGVAYDGILGQHLPDRSDFRPHRSETGAMIWHEAEIVPESVLARVYGDGRREIDCHHHQFVEDAGRLRVTARATDGVVEGVEDVTMPFVVGVQWHPEQVHGDPLFAAFLDAAR